METLKTIDFIIFLGISQGLFLAITLNLVHSKNKSANKILSLILISSTIMLIGRLLYNRFYEDPYLFRIATTVDTVVFIIGPLIYTYCRRLTFIEKTIYKPPLKFFILAIIHLCFTLYTYTINLEIFQVRSFNGYFFKAYLITELMGIIINFYFLIKSFSILKLYKKQESLNLSYKQNITSFLYTFLVIYALILIGWVISFISTYVFSKVLPFLNYDIIWVFIPLLIYTIGFFSLKHPEIFRLPLLETSKFKHDHKRLSTKDIKQLEARLKQVILEDKIYLQSDLTLKGLADALNTSTNNLSWFLNNIIKTSFYDYINTYRISEFVAKIENGDYKKHTIQALSIDAGFNSKSTFNKAFKLQMQETPSSYIKKISASS